MNKIYFHEKELRTFVLHLDLYLNEVQFKPELIIGISRGGLIPAVYLSHKYNCQMASLDISFRDGVVDFDLPTLMDKIQNKKVIIVDEIVDSGKTYDFLQKSLQSNYLENIKWIALYENCNRQYSDVLIHYSEYKLYKTVDYSPWIVFPWENEYLGED